MMVTTNPARAQGDKPADRNTADRPAVGKQGMVSSAHPLATQAGLEVLNWFWQNMGAFNQLQSQQPLTLAHALADSPAGLLGWNIQLLPENLDDDFILANVATYWLTGTAGSAIRFYREMALDQEKPEGPTTVPTALAGSANDFSGIRRFAEHDHANIVRWNVYETPGHYTAHQAPGVLADDVVEFFGGLV